MGLKKIFYASAFPAEATIWDGLAANVFDGSYTFELKFQTYHKFDKKEIKKIKKSG